MGEVQISSHKRRGVTSPWSRRLWIVWACGVACTPAAVMPTGDARAPVRQGIPPLGTTTVPIQIVHDVVLVPADVDGHRGLWLLDTGSPTIALNSVYLRQGAAGRLDTVLTADSSAHESGWVASEITVHIGTLAIHVDPATAKAAAHGHVMAVGMPWGVKDAQTGQPLLGILGLPMWAQYETIIDYTRRQLTLIPIDTLGRRLAVVPWYTPRMTVPIFYGPYSPQGEYWFLQARLGGVVDTLVIDTGNRLNELNAATQSRFARHLTPTGRTAPTDGENTPEVTLDRLDIAGQSYAAVPFYVSHHREDSIGDAFLRHLGVVGFNFRAHQLVVYR